MPRRHSPDASSVLAPRIVAAAVEAVPGAVVAVPHAAVVAAVLVNEVVVGPPIPPLHRMGPRRPHDGLVSGLLPCP